MPILAISRHTDYSPGMTDNDAAILDAVVAELRDCGHTVTVTTEAGFMTMPDADIPHTVIHMARCGETLQRLIRLQDAGHRILNDPRGVECTARDSMTHIFDIFSIPQPEGCTIPTDAGPWFANHPEWHNIFPGWLKRCDYHAIDAADVTYVATPADADRILADYAARGLRRVVYQQHLRGDLVKFYSVAGTSFFHWFYPQDVGHSKFGLERHNDRPCRRPFDTGHLRDICHQAALHLGLQIFGGDCIVSPDGRCRIIDFNDWPSFAPCRMEAADAITQLILNQR